MTETDTTTTDSANSSGGGDKGGQTYDVTPFADGLSEIERELVDDLSRVSINIGQLSLRQRTQAVLGDGEDAETGTNNTSDRQQADDDIRRFVDEHDIDVDGQHKCLVEEVGELSEALLTDASDDAVAEELADVLFVARTIAVQRDIDVDEALATVAAENAQKDATTDGKKVTKDGGDTSGGGDDG